MRCPSCKNKVVQQTGTVTRVRVKGILEIHPDGSCHSKCFWCGSDVVVPLAFTGRIPEAEERFVVPLLDEEKRRT